MRYNKIRKMDISNGPGVRVSIFMQGCSFHCKNCFNQETWDFDGGKEFTDETIEHILDLCDNEYIVGLSIKQSNCSNYPNYSCTDNFEEILDKSIYENNYYHHIKIDGNDIYNKADFPVYQVYCKNTSNENCVYYIGMKIAF